eukprot:762559-Pleurochrysis_carterae.AAC.3
MCPRTSTSNVFLSRLARLPQVKVLKFFPSASRWGVQCVGSGEGLKVKAENLTPLGENEAVEEEEDSGVYVNARLGDKNVAIDPAELKRRFQATPLATLHSLLQLSPF